MPDREIREAPDYSNAALTMLGVNLLWCFGLVWALFGFWTTILLALILNHGITRLSTRRG